MSYAFESKENFSFTEIFASPLDDVNDLNLLCFLKSNGGSGGSGGGSVKCTILDHHRENIIDQDKDIERNDNSRINHTRTTATSTQAKILSIGYTHDQNHIHHHQDGHHYELPSVNASVPLFFRIPQLLPGIIIKRRLYDMVYFAGDELKQGLIDEMSTHILIDSLFFTITASPIYSNALPATCYTYACRLSIMLTYIVFNVQLWTITLNAIFLFALLEVPSIACKEWMSRREYAVCVVGRLHVLGLYLFVLNFFLWPFANYDNFYQIVCTVTSLSTWLFVLYFTGTTVTNGIFDSLNPAIKLIGKPKNMEIRHIAESDLRLFKQLEKPSLPNSIDDFLTDLNLSHLLPIFVEANINMHLLLHLDLNDFRSMKISIGDRIIIQQALRCYQH
jgi:hypothetical protein